MFRKKSPKRLYYPTKSRWYRKPRRASRRRASRKVFSYGIRTHFTRFVKDFFVYVVVGAIVLALIIFLLFSSKFSITNIEVARDDLHIDSAVVMELLDDYRGKSIFAFSRSDARDLIQKSYPEFSKVIVRKLLPNTIKVELETYEIVANVRAYYILPQVEETIVEDDEKVAAFNEALKTSFDLQVGTSTEYREELTPIEQKALLNSIGQAIFDREEDLELMVITVDGLSQPIEDRQFVIPTNDMQYVTDSIRYFTNLLQIEIIAGRYLPIAHEVHLTTQDNLVLWLSTDKDYKQQIDKLDTIYRVAELDKEDLAYIDLRIREKIIYCPRRTSCDK